MGKRWLLYGANGYTGRLVAAGAARFDERPILAGRRASALREVAGDSGLEERVFGLDDPERLRAALEDVDAVVHAAGPFSATSRPMVEACLATGTHYLDITGEIDVFEAVLARHDEAVAAGVALLPGVGLDVVPTDCLAARLAAELPSASSLELAFYSRGAASPGTTRTSLEGLAAGNRARIDGRIVATPQGSPVREIPFADRRRDAVSIPWGDVSTAFHSTGIPNIRVYLAMPKDQSRKLRWMGGLGRVLRLRPALRAAQYFVGRAVKGPDAAARAAGRSEFWGEVLDPEGRRVSATLSGPEGYTMTAESCLRAVRRVLDGGVPPGAWTPSQAFGADYVEQLDGVTFHGFAR